MRLRNRGGFTLIEVMVASTLALVVLTLVVTIFIPALRAWTDGQKRSEVGQSLLITSGWLREDVVRCSPGSLKLTDEGVLVMKCAMGQTVDHNNPFSQQVAYWQEGSDLFRSTLMLADPDSETVPNLAGVRTWPDRRKVAGYVTDFEVLIPQGWRLELFLAVDKEGRKGEIRTGYSSIYAPFDLEIAAENETETSPPPGP